MGRSEACSEGHPVKLSICPIVQRDQFYGHLARAVFVGPVGTTWISQAWELQRATLASPLFPTALLLPCLGRNLLCPAPAVVSHTCWRLHCGRLSGSKGLVASQARSQATQSHLALGQLPALRPQGEEKGLSLGWTVRLMQCTPALLLVGPSSPPSLADGNWHKLCLPATQGSPAQRWGGAGVLCLVIEDLYNILNFASWQKKPKILIFVGSLVQGVIEIAT